MNACMISINAKSSKYEDLWNSALLKVPIDASLCDLLKQMFRLCWSPLQNHVCVRNLLRDQMSDYVNFPFQCCSHMLIRRVHGTRVHGTRVSASMAECQFLCAALSSPRSPPTPAEFPPTPGFA